MTLTKKIGVFLFVSALFLFASANSHAVEKSSLLGEGRYFVRSENGLVQRLFGARHHFEGGFTTDLTRGELWTLTKLFRVNVADVPLYVVSESNVASSLENLFNISEKEAEEENSLQREKFAENTLNWGTKLVYGGGNIHSTHGGEGVRVAVLDTGISRKHFDLSARVAGCADFTRSSVVEDVCEDRSGHGTHVAGVIAADGGFDGQGIWGVAPEAEILAYKTCSSEGACWADDVAVAIDYAVENGANIISMSFARGAAHYLVEDSIERAVSAGVLLVASSGSSEDLGELLAFPGSSKDVVAVGAIDEELLVPEWSIRGTNNGDFIIEEGEIEFAMPGSNIESTWLGNGYRYLSGTSVAAPFVSGLAAKLWTGDAESTRELLQSLAINIEGLGDTTSSGLGAPILFR